MAGKGKAELPPPVMPFTGEVDAIEPEVVEYQAPNVEGVKSQAPTLVAVPPVFSPDDNQPEVEAEAEAPSKGKGRG